MISFGIALQAQEVIATGGDYNSNGGGSISYTIGEIAIASYANTHGILLEGFQSSTIDIISAIEINHVDYKITAYPNPVVSELKLSIYQGYGKGLMYLVYDISGRLIKQDFIKADDTIIPFNNLVNSTYVVKVVSKEKDIKTFTIIKN